jgi:aspartyl-tRNA(Asn)/glutamyl-tRNA(Gln) amidotransferase subunit A
MDYNLSVREYLDQVNGRNFDRSGFLHHVIDESKKLDVEYNFFRYIGLEDISFSSGLTGLPVSVKDNICVQGVVSSAGSRILENYVPPFDATAVLRVKQAGGNVIGKTNQDEFGFGTFSTNCAFGVPKNPHDKERSCGGSSGGAAGLTAAADFPHIALAESTGGSISCPASFCGVVGLTPTYGLVSRYGLIDYANSLDKIGVIGKTVFDVALLLSVIAGHDEKDFTSLSHRKYDYTKSCKDYLHGKRIAVPKEYFRNIDKGVEKTVWNAIDILKDRGAKISEVSLPTTDFALSAYYIIATAEASTNLAKYCGIRYGLSEEIEGNFDEYFSKVRSRGFGEEAKRRIMLGTFARMAGYRDQYYLKAMQARTMIINDFKRVFSRYDAIAAPTMPVIAPKFSEIKKLTPLQVYQMDVLTVGPNLAGLPHISMPCGTSKGMPVGLHLISDHLQEAEIIEIAYAFEQAAKKKDDNK